MWKNGFRAFLLLCTATVAVGQTVLDTTSAWTGGFESAWGSTGSATPTYGQSFQAPAGVSVLSSIEFELQDTSGAIPYQAYVYAWNGTGITGPALFTSSLQTLNVTSGYQSITIDTASTAMTPGNDYMAFFSTLGDGGSNGGVTWEAVPDSTYPGGTLMYNTAGQFTAGTGSLSDLTSGWGAAGQDAAFQFTFDATPEPATVVLCSMSFLCLFGFNRLKRS